MTPPAKVVVVPLPRPLNEEIIIKEECARDRPNPLQIIQNVYNITKEALCDGYPHEYYHSMIFVVVNYRFSMTLLFL